MLQAYNTNQSVLFKSRVYMILAPGCAQFLLKFVYVIGSRTVSQKEFTTTIIFKHFDWVIISNIQSECLK